MHLAKITRRLLSVSFHVNPEKRDSSRIKPRARLRLEMLEHRTVPATAVFVAASHQILITPTIAAETISLTAPSTGVLNVSSNTVVPGQNPDADFNIASQGITNILVDGSITELPVITFQAGAVLTQPDLSGIQQIAFVTGTGVAPTADFSNFDATPIGSSTTPSVYFVTDFGAAAGPQTYKAPMAGVSVVRFHDQAASGNAVTIDTSAATAQSMTFLDFGALTSAVNVNLTEASGGQIASYTNNTTTLTGSAASLWGARGGEGDNNYIGNPAQDQYFIGGLGNSNISTTGAAFTDQINAIYDLSPSLAGTLQTTGYLSGTYAWDKTQVVNLTTFSTTVESFRTALAGSSSHDTSAATLFSDFGMFDIGENVPTFATMLSTSVAAPVVTTKFKVTVSAGTANASVFGYQDVSLTAIGNGGNESFQDGQNALPSFLSGGDGTCILQGEAGDTLIAGNGKTTIQFFADGASPTNVTTLETGDGTGTVAATAPDTTVDVGVGTYDLNGLLDDPTVILIYNDTTTLNGANLFANPSLIPSMVQAATR